MRFVVTGGAGFIGAALCHRLVGHGEVIAVDSGLAGDWGRLPAPAQAVNLDIDTMTKDDWLEVLRPDDVVFHLAARKYNSPNTRSEHLIETNVNASLRLFEAAQAASIERLVFASSLYAYGVPRPAPFRELDVPEPTTVYGSTKLMGEALLRTVGTGGLRWNVARLFFIYGPHQFAEGGYKSVIISNFERMQRGEPPVVRGSGNQRLDYVYVDDCVEALWRLAISESAGETVNVSSGRAISIRELTELMRGISGFPGGPRFESPDWTEGTVRVGDSRRLFELADWAPSVPLPIGLQRVWAWMAGGGQTRV